MKDNKLEIGDFVNIEGLEKYNNFKIVGEVISPIYFSMDRGQSVTQNGQVKYYAYVLENVVESDFYSQVYVTVEGANDLLTDSSLYKREVEKVQKKIEARKEELEERRFLEIYGDYINKANANGIKLDTSNYARPKIMINLRSDNQAYNDVLDASDNIGKLGNVFPIVFYLIAILISLITMMRMVEEDRLENGTMKALGYKVKDVLFKYLLFSFSATIIGGILGVIVFSSFVPKIIWNIYQMMFTVPYFVRVIDYQYTLIGLLAAVFCICGSTIFTCFKSLKDVPALLMRPKAPTNGRRVLLEKIPFVWKRLKFSSKITVRNIFRYKSRVLATIVGITGCTALLLAGFGLRDAISDIVTYQYDKLFHYDRMLVVKGVSSKEKIFNVLDEEVATVNYIGCLIRDSKIKYKGHDASVTLVSSSDYKSLSGFISLYDAFNGEVVYPSKSEMAISLKTSKVLGIKVGDYLTVLGSDNKEHKVKVSNILENYVGQYVYLGKDIYEEIFWEYRENSYLLNFSSKMKDEEIKELDNELIKTGDVLSILDVSGTIDLVNKTMDSLNSVVVILIVVAAVLAFVVLYNLSNINICERKREIATLKVLGFYNKEVDSYITRENILLTIIGIGLGLFFGKYLSNFIISTCEPDTVMFVREIRLVSYIISAIMTILFTVIINTFTHFSLKKIDMISSLKNVE